MSSESEQESEKLRSKSSFSDTESFHSQYVVLKTISHGGNAKVKLALHRLTGTPVAVKIIRKRQHWCYPVTSEVEILMMANHPNIISLFQVIETEKTIYLVMELADGKPLYQHIREAGHLQEEEARRIFKQILSAVSYCHDQGIIHRDLKPDNIMVDRNGKVKIIDFGLSTQVKPEQKLSLQCGTYPFSAPELLLGRLYDGPKIDVWTLGVVLYFMTTGRIPFDAASIPQLRRQVVSAKFPVSSDLSIELQDLLSLLMAVNPKHRPTITKVMMHPWLKEDPEGLQDTCDELISLTPDPDIVKAMQHIGFKAQDIKDSLYYKKYNETMAAYCLLKEQALQGCDSPTRAPSMNLWMTPFPSLEDTATFPVGQRRRKSEPTLLWSSSNSQVSAYGQKDSRIGHRRVSWPGALLSRPHQAAPTMGQAHMHSRSVPCIYSMHYRGSSNKSIKDTPSSSAEHKPVPSVGQPRGLKSLTRKIGNALRKLCCCFPARRKPRLGQNRVSPQK